MVIWTRDGLDRWTRAERSEALEGLSGETLEAVFVLTNPPVDNQEVVALLHLIRGTVGSTARLTVATRFSDSRWVARWRAAGADRVVLVLGGAASDDTPPMSHAMEVGTAVCPALHTHRTPRTALSVCGQHQDRMVLGRHHLGRWCLARKAACPHWQREPNHEPNIETKEEAIHHGAA